jgi:hypothetical protein
MKHIRQGDGRETGESTQSNFGRSLGKIELGFVINGVFNGWCTEGKNLPLWFIHK